MKKVFSLLFITITSLINKTIKAQVKNYKVTYRHCFQSDTTRQLLDTLGQEAILTGNSKFSSYNFSKYFSPKTSSGDFAKEYDDIFKQKKSGLIKIHSGIYADSIGNIVFHDKKLDSIQVRERLMEEYVLTSEKLPNINWEILDEYKVIDKYKSRKAVCTFRGRQYTAWFTTELPVVDGPWKFKTLPGLVLDIYDNRNQVKIYAVSIDYPTNEVVPNFQTLGRKIEMPEYFNYKAVYIEKRRQTMEAIAQSQPNLGEGVAPRIKRIKSVLYCIEMWAD